MAGVVLGQDQLRPELLDDPVREVVVLEEVYLLPHLRFVEVAVETAQPVLYLGRFLDDFRLEPPALFGLHEVYDLLGADFCIIDEEGILHGVLLDEVYDFYPLDVVLFVDEKIQFLPLLCYDIEVCALVDELAQGLQDADVDSQPIYCAGF